MGRQRPIKVLLAKVALDGHDRGVLVVAQGLREEGMEVVYTGLRQSPENIVARALEEKIDVIGLSSLSGGHNLYFPKVVALAREKGMGNILIIAGGIFPYEDISNLKDKGISAIFGPGTPIKEIANYIRDNVKLEA